MSVSAPKRILRTFRRSDSGSAAVEFSLVAVPFFALLFAIIETGIVFFAGQVLENGVQDSGRLIYTNQITNTKAKVGDYAFTTLRPQLGVVHHRGREFVLADIPGLIAGAAEGAGVGDRFLGHIERCRVLLHLIDVQGTDAPEEARAMGAAGRAFVERWASPAGVAASYEALFVELIAARGT